MSLYLSKFACACGEAMSAGAVLASRTVRNGNHAWEVPEGQMCAAAAFLVWIIALLFPFYGKEILHPQEHALACLLAPQAQDSSARSRCLDKTIQVTLSINAGRRHNQCHYGRLWERLHSLCVPGRLPHDCLQDGQGQGCLPEASTKVLASPTVAVVALALIRGHLAPVTHHSAHRFPAEIFQP